MNKKQMIDELHKMLDLPFKDFMEAAKRYDEGPSILRGARKQETRDDLDIAIKRAAEYVFENWHLTPEEFAEIIDEMRYQ